MNVPEEVRVPVTVQKIVTRPVPYPVTKAPIYDSPIPSHLTLPSLTSPHAVAAFFRFCGALPAFYPAPLPCLLLRLFRLWNPVPTPVEVRVPQSVQVAVPVETIRYRDVPYPVEQVASHFFLPHSLSAPIFLPLVSMFVPSERLVFGVFAPVMLFCRKEWKNFAGKRTYQCSAL